VTAPVRLLVTVGTDHHPFDRLVRWVDGWLSTQDPSRVHAVMQFGTSQPPQHADGLALVGRDEMAGLLADADMVICHGGPATIADARKAGLLPIVVPRESGRHEHVDDHQVLFTARLGEAGLVRLVRAEQDLRQAMDLTLDDSATWRLSGASHLAADDATSAAAAIGRVVGQLVERRQQRILIKQARTP
jgi:UDP-N-acetylglucosamine transferase subunit ALG13